MTQTHSATTDSAQRLASAATPGRSESLPNILRRVRAAYHPGWGGVPEYSGWRDEQLAWKTTCTIGDWSFLWDVVVEGPDALRFFSDTSVNSFARFEVGQAKHVVQCNRDGKVIGEGVLLRLGEHTFATQSSSAYYSAYRLSRGGYNATWRHQDTFQLQVAGPRAIDLIEELAGESVRDIRFMRFRPVEIAEHRMLALRQGMSGEIGFELHGDAAVKTEVLHAILKTGKPYGIRQLGNRTAMINHLEACFPTVGWHYLADVFGPDVDGYIPFLRENFDLFGLTQRITGSFESDDINDYLRSPVELGWGKSIKFDHEFIGRSALEREVAAPRRHIVTVEFDEADVLEIYSSQMRAGRPYDFLDIPTPQRWSHWADALRYDGQVVGVSTVPGYSAHFQRVLALAYVNVELTAPGTELSLLWGNPGTPHKDVRVTVAPAPYKTDRRRDSLTVSA